MSKKIAIATVFSGIGAFEFALRRLHINHEIVFACDNGEREIEYDVSKEKETVFSLDSTKSKKEYVDQLYLSKTRKTNYVQQSYLANYPQCSPEQYYQDIVLLDGRDYRSKVDIFVGGSPCQSFSSVGQQGGLEDARGTLFYEYARLIQEINPKVFIYENVRNLLNHDKGHTWRTIKNIFDKLGYDYQFAILNSSDYGIPQTRRRLFVVGFRSDLHAKILMPPKTKKLLYTMKDFTINNCDVGFFSFDKTGKIKIKKKEGTPNSNYVLTPLLYKYVMKSGTKNWSQKVEINLPIARTLLKTMGNRHRAGVDNYLSFDGTTKLGSVRMLTEREAHRLMGFTDDYKIVVSKSQAYKQAGNSIVVDVLMALLKEILATGVFEND